MFVRLLGTGTSQGIPIIGCHCPICTSTDERDHRLRTSALVEVDGVNILIDAGPDLRQQLLRCGVTRLDALLLTHEHKDHTGGIDDVRPINFLMKTPLNIYGQPRVMKAIRNDYSYAFGPDQYPGVPQLVLNSLHEFHIRNREEETDGCKSFGYQCVEKRAALFTLQSGAGVGHH